MALTSLAILTGTACASSRVSRYEGNVTVEDQRTAGSRAPGDGRTPSAGAIHPPVCGDNLPLPTYPQDLLGPAAGTVRVRVDFLLTRDGFPEQIAASFADDVQEPIERGELFLDAAEAAIDQWRCAAAWRRPEPGESVAWVPVSYQAWIVLRFDAERVDGRATLEKKQQQ